MRSHALILLLLAAQCAFSATYHVTKTGSDAADGSSGTPWLTVQKAANTVIAGDVVNIGTGQYDEAVSETTSGTAGSPIVYQGSGTITKFTASGASYLHFYNLNFGTSNSTYYGYALNLSSTSYGCVVSNVIVDMELWFEHNGVSLDGTNNWVINSTLKGANNCALVGWGGAFNVVSNCTFKDSIDADMNLIWGRSNYLVSCTVTNNLDGTNSNHMDFVQSFGYDSNSISQYIFIEGNLVINNDIQMAQIEQSRGDDIHNDFQRLDHWYFRNNAFINTAGTLTFYIPDVTVENNTFYLSGRSTGTAVFSRYSATRGLSTNLTIRNNVFLECGSTPANTSWGWYWIENNLQTNTAYFDYNYVAGTSYAAKTGFVFGGFESHGINGGNPNFVDITLHPRFSSSSFLKDTATNIVSVVPKDIYGTSRPQGSALDIGAFEYIAPATTYPGFSFGSGVKLIGPGRLTQ